MTVYLLDTNQLSAMLKGDPVIREKIGVRLSSGRFGVAMITVGELWYMVFNSATPQRNAEQLRELLSDIVRFEFNEEAAEEFGRVKAALRRLGKPIPDPDSQIAAIARINDLIVLTADAHFDYVPGLKTENWTQ